MPRPASVQDRTAARRQFYILDAISTPLRHNFPDPTPSASQQFGDRIKRFREPLQGLVASFTNTDFETFSISFKALQLVFNVWQRVGPSCAFNLLQGTGLVLAAAVAKQRRFSIHLGERLLRCCNEVICKLSRPQAVEKRNHLLGICADQTESKSIDLSNFIPTTRNLLTSCFPAGADAAQRTRKLSKWMKGFLHLVPEAAEPEAAEPAKSLAASVPDTHIDEVLDEKRWTHFRSVCSLACSIHGDSCHGTGFFVGRGFVMTSAHVIRPRDQAQQTSFVFTSPVANAPLFVGPCTDRHCEFVDGTGVAIVFGPSLTQVYDRIVKSLDTDPDNASQDLLSGDKSVRHDLVAVIHNPVEADAVFIPHDPRLSFAEISSFVDSESRLDASSVKSCGPGSSGGAVLACTNAHLDGSTDTPPPQMQLVGIVLGRHHDGEIAIAPRKHVAELLQLARLKNEWLSRESVLTMGILPEAAQDSLRTEAGSWKTKYSELRNTIRKSHVDTTHNTKAS